MALAVTATIGVSWLGPGLLLIRLVAWDRSSRNEGEWGWYVGGEAVFLAHQGRDR